MDEYCWLYAGKKILAKSNSSFYINDSPVQLKTFGEQGYVDKFKTI